MGKSSALKHLTEGPGWTAFFSPDQYLHSGLVLVLATASGFLLANHPVYRGRGMTLEDLEQKKTLVIYSAVGALIAIICMVAPSMAFVIFGIGGLMRFRSNTGESKSTGHTIIGTLVGLCWGLGLQLVAVLATLYFWLMIWFLERDPVLELTVFGVELANMPRAVDAYRQALLAAGCSVLGQNKVFKKEKLFFYLLVHTPKGFGVNDAEKISANIPEDLRGVLLWPE